MELTRRKEESAPGTNGKHPYDGLNWCGASPRPENKLTAPRKCPGIVQGQPLAGISLPEMSMQEDEWAEVLGSVSSLRLDPDRDQQKGSQQHHIRSVAVVAAALEQDKLDRLDSLPVEVKSQILSHLRYEQLFQLQLLSKGWKALIHSAGFRRALVLKDQPVLTACYFFIKHGVWQWAGFDPKLRTTSTTGMWRRLPPLTFLPSDCTPDADYTQSLMCTGDGLACMNFSQSPHEARLLVFNPLTQHTKELPPLLHQRKLVLMHMLTYPVTHSYQILAAGSSGAGDEQLSKITEIYDSRTNGWERVGDLPGVDCSLNEYQYGVLYKGNILCIGFVKLHGEIVRGVLEYNVAEHRWNPKWTEHTFSSSKIILQLVENGGELYLFSERESTGRVVVEHVVERIEWDSEVEASFKLETVVVVSRKSGSKSREMPPEFGLVFLSQWRFCIYNTFDHTGDVFDVSQGFVLWEPLPVLPGDGFKGELGFFALNPMFIVQPRFSARV